MPFVDLEKTIPPFKESLPWVTLVSCMFLFVYLNRAILGPLLIFFEEEFTLNHTQSTSLLLYLAAGNALSTLLSASTCAFIQPRLLVTFAVCLSGVSLFLIAQASSFVFLTIFVVCLGVSSGQYMNAGLSVMRSIVRLKDWPKAIAIHELGPTLSFIIAPVLAATIALTFGWRVLLMGLGVFTFLGGILFACIAKGGRTTTQQLQFHGIKDILRSPFFWLCAALFSITMTGEFAIYSVMPLHLTQSFNFDVSSATYLLSISRFAPPIAILFGGWLTTRFGTVKTLQICLITYGISTLLLAVPQLHLTIACMFIQPVVVALSFPPLFTYLIEQFSVQQQPMLMPFIIPIGTIFGSGIIPQLLGMVSDYLNFNVGFFVLSLIIFLCSYWLHLLTPIPTKNI